MIGISDLDYEIVRNRVLAFTGWVLVADVENIAESVIRDSFGIPPYPTSWNDHRNVYTFRRVASQIIDELVDDGHLKRYKAGFFKRTNILLLLAEASE